jgi:dipeptidyl aminopeptidase/acylaminoacyl peptidase
MYSARILNIFSSAMDRSSLSIKLSLLLILPLLNSCSPENDDTKPYNYIIEGPKDLYPAFSPDGEYIAYFHDAWDTPSSPGYPTGLYIINKDGTNRQLVLEGQHWSPSWSPDGEWLVFSTTDVIQKCKRTVKA